MISTLALATVVGVLFFWVMSTRTTRAKWLRELDLPGMWIMEDGDSEDTSITFQGNFDGGEYILKQDNVVRKGSWHLQGSKLILTDVNETDIRYELRQFEDQVIGIDGPGIERGVFSKHMENIVPFKSRSRRR